MFSNTPIKRAATVCALAAIALLTGLPGQWSGAEAVAQTRTERHAAFHWVTQAGKSRTALWTKARGALTIDGHGVEFRANNGRTQRWRFEEIRTAYLGPRRIMIETYLNRSLHRPGLRHYRFDLSQPLPPAVAAELAARIDRPIQNDDPDASAPAMATIAVRHRELTHGTNGVLRVRKGGIDYVTSSKGDSRSWRWADIQALSEPDPYHLYVFGYRDTYTFDLKAPLSRELFHYATDEIYRSAEAGEAR